jgi:uncharacterized membrane protein
MTRRSNEVAGPLLRAPPVPPVLSAPLHPIFVHFTIVLTAASFVLDLLSRVLDRSPNSQAAGNAALWALGAAVIITVGTLITGVVSRMRVPMGNGPAHSYLRVHMALGPLFFGLLLIAITWRFALYNRVNAVPPSYLVLLGTVCVIMTLQGYLGGELVYRFGTAVERHYRALSIEHPGVRPCPVRESTDATESARA